MSERAPSLRFPESLDTAAFIQHYWQRRPLLLPDGLDIPDNFPDPATLAGMACEDDVEARLVDLQKGRRRLRNGPFVARELRELPATDWILLVQDVDKYDEAAAALRHLFRFLPSWRLDDVMVSVAAPGGSVGPHVDAYDVFLVQISGVRRWDVGAMHAPRDTVEDDPLRVLQRFEAVETWTVTPGDVLYLPPGVPHHGVGDNLSVTASVGLRAPSHAELLLAHADSFATTVDAQARYTDRDLGPGEANDGLIAPATIDRVRDILAGYVDTEPDRRVEWFGRLVTETKPWLTAPATVSPVSRSAFRTRLGSGHELVIHPWVRFARSEFPGAGWLFADGESCLLEHGDDTLARCLCAGDNGALRNAVTTESAGTLLYDLYCAGKLYWLQDE